MTSPKPRFKRPLNTWHPVELNDEQKARLRSIKDEDSFVSDITGIANNYADTRKILKNSISLGDARETLKDLKKNASSLAEKLENLPQDIEMGLWRLREQWSHLGIEIRGDNVSLPNLLRDLEAEISRVVSDDLVDGKAGRKKASLEQGTADSLRECFKRHGLKYRPNTWPDAYEDPECDIIFCLGFIFNLGLGENEKPLSREALSTYLKRSERITPKKR